MAENVKKAESNSVDTDNESLDEILAKGIERYDKTLKKLSKN